MRDSRIDAWILALAASDSPAYDSYLGPTTVEYHQGASTVTLKEKNGLMIRTLFTGTIISGKNSLRPLTEQESFCALPAQRKLSTIPPGAAAPYFALQCAFDQIGTVTCCKIAG